MEHYRKWGECERKPRKWADPNQQLSFILFISDELSNELEMLSSVIEVLGESVEESEAQDMTNRMVDRIIDRVGATLLIDEDDNLVLDKDEMERIANRRRG